MSDFNVHDVLLAAMIVSAAQDERKVAWLAEDGTIVNGTIRHMHLKPDTDLRTAEVRVTLDTGFEYHTTPLELAEMDSFHVME